jgi:hypothetical protein
VGAWEGVRQDPLEVFDLGDGRFVVDGVPQAGGEPACPG